MDRKIGIIFPIKCYSRTDKSSVTDGQTILNRLTLQVGEGFKAHPIQNLHFWHLFVIQMTPKKFDFSYKPMRMPPILFRGLKMVKKGVSIAFLWLAVTNS